MDNSTNLSCVYSLTDFSAMFDLTEQDLQCKMLVFPAGLSSFNAELQEKGIDTVVSVDEKYNLSPMDMVKHVDFVVQSLAEQGKTDVNVIAQTFLADYSAGIEAGRYVAVNPTQMPFENDQFELALCPERISLEALLETIRVAHEVRLFPLLDEKGEIAAELGPIMLTLQENNLGLEVRQVSYEKNTMLRIWSNECVVA